MARAANIFSGLLEKGYGLGGLTINGELSTSTSYPEMLCYAFRVSDSSGEYHVNLRIPANKRDKRLPFIYVSPVEGRDYSESKIADGYKIRGDLQ
jgi:hypothetical protein